MSPAKGFHAERDFAGSIVAAERLNLDGGHRPGEGASLHESPARLPPDVSPDEFVLERVERLRVVEQP